ncbi:hypothetical protein M0638_20380 [Roseomonas sp. NAR14]|uniref:DUF6950 domain-containing protein n=2 Tax=Roseomonas acroporae TaxID=2937791 RepID=A0A9X2BVI6_9PROT|nr:hypothetical protein [Roseomonas acroporae]MCK8786732.1 hypothetical protein [Roseomonas acroporae]
MGGPDLGRDWRGTYDGEADARGVIESYGQDLEAACAEVCQAAGMQEVQPALAQRGDLLVLRDRALLRGVPALAICNGATAMTVTHRGLIAMPMRVAVRAWVV